MYLFALWWYSNAQQIFLKFGRKFSFCNSLDKFVGQKNSITITPGWGGWISRDKATRCTPRVECS